MKCNGCVCTQYCKWRFNKKSYEQSVDLGQRKLTSLSLSFDVRFLCDVCAQKANANCINIRFNPIPDVHI